MSSEIVYPCDHEHHVKSRLHAPLILASSSCDAISLSASHRYPQPAHVQVFDFVDTGSAFCVVVGAAAEDSSPTASRTPPCMIPEVVVAVAEVLEGVVVAVSTISYQLLPRLHCISSPGAAPAVPASISSSEPTVNLSLFDPSDPQGLR
jgi:hypothetical protein